MEKEQRRRMRFTNLIIVFWISFIVGCTPSTVEKTHGPKLILANGDKALTPYYSQLAQIHKEMLEMATTVGSSLDEVYANKKMNKRYDVGRAIVFGARAHQFTLKNRLLRVSTNNGNKQLTELELKLDEILNLQERLYDFENASLTASVSKNTNEIYKLGKDITLLTTEIVTKNRILADEFLPKEYRSAYAFHLEYSQVAWDRIVD